MRRFLRILRTSLTILSLILFLATIALWSRSYFREDYMTLGGLDWWSSRGAVSVSNDSTAIDTRNTQLAYMFDQLARRRSDARVAARFGAEAGSSPPSVAIPQPAEAWNRSVPIGVLAVAFAILPALKLRAILRARKQTRGFEVITKSI